MTRDWLVHDSYRTHPRRHDDFVNLVLLGVIGAAMAQHVSEKPDQVNGRCASDGKAGVVDDQLCDELSLPHRRFGAQAYGLR